MNRRESVATQLARDIAYGVGDDREGWYGAAEARALADEVLRLRTLLRMGAVGGETEEIRAWCRLALDISGESSTPASEMLAIPEQTTCGSCGLITTGRIYGCPRELCPLTEGSEQAGNCSQPHPAQEQARSGLPSASEAV